MKFCGIWGQSKKYIYRWKLQLHVPGPNELNSIVSSALSPGCEHKTYWNSLLWCVERIRYIVIDTFRRVCWALPNRRPNLHRLSLIFDLDLICAALPNRRTLKHNRRRRDFCICAALSSGWTQKYAVIVWSVYHQLTMGHVDVFFVLFIVGVCNKYEGISITTRKSTGVFLHIEAWTIWPSFCRWQIQMNSSWNVCILIQILLGFVSEGLIDNKPDNSLAPSRQ